MTDFVNNSKNEIQKQFANSNITQLIIQKAIVQQKYIGKTIDNMISELVDWRTCSGEALDRWGQILQVPRVYRMELGGYYTVPDDEYRYFIGIGFFRTNWKGDLYSANETLREIYGERGTCQILDNCDMQFTSYVFLMNTSKEVDYILANYDILPRISGLGVSIIVRDKYYYANQPTNYKLPGNTTTGINDFNDDNVKVMNEDEVGTLSYED
jgi:hypothetical protein